MSSLVVREMQVRAAQVRGRLMNPRNSVRDMGIDLKRKTTPIISADVPQVVPISTLDIFGPRHPSIDDLAFGPVIYHRPRFIRIEDIQRAVSAKYNVPREELGSARRTAPILRPRQVAMYLCRILTPKSLPEIGRHFGGKHHTSILHAYRKIGALRAIDTQLNVEIVELIEAVNDVI